MLHRLGHEHVVERVQHLLLARGGDVHLHVEADVLRLRARQRGEPPEAERGGNGDDC